MRTRHDRCWPTPTTRLPCVCLIRDSEIHCRRHAANQGAVNGASLWAQRRYAHSRRIQRVPIRSKFSKRAELFPAAMLGELPVAFRRTPFRGRTLKGRVPILVTDQQMSRQNDSGLWDGRGAWGFNSGGGDVGLYSPATIRAAWMHERTEFMRWQGRANNGCLPNPCGNFNKRCPVISGFSSGCRCNGDGPLGNQGLANGRRSRIEATWLWLGLVTYRLEGLVGMAVVAGDSVVIVAYLDRHYMRRFNKYSFVA